MECHYIIIETVWGESEFALKHAEKVYKEFVFKKDKW